MKIRKRGKSQVQKTELCHEVYCPACGQFVEKVKKKKLTEKLFFECSKCTAKFKIVFPGTDESDDGWPRGL